MRLIHRYFRRAVKWNVSTWVGVVCILTGALSACADTTPLIQDKTLVAWVTPANLTQRGGSVLTIEKSGGVFDAIVFGEIAPGKWMAGSNG
ncbi:MAG TPA: hypothetical protein PLC40_16705, partial [Candidatus Hydrogenedentes bacterium]|nr:hypothetical protein [Candidatus Hydrogenedentota bacterium]